MAKVDDLVIKVSLDAAEFYAQLAEITWRLFVLAHPELTIEEQKGARIYHDWAKERYERWA